MRRLALAFTLLFGVYTFPLGAQPALQSPSVFLGYTLGEAFTQHHRVIDYFEYVAEARPNVTLQTYGETYEGRPLMVAFVSSPEHMERLEEIRTDNLKRAGLMEGEPTGEPVAIVWLSYNVHGNESVSTEASMQTLYELSNPGHARTQAWLENTVVVLDPCINPDGRERYVGWYKQMLGFRSNPVPQAREHYEPWPGGRTNHYMFDLNRDWAWQVQRESQARIPLYRDWMPHVHVDFHEQGVDEPYYFAPAAEPYHLAITDWQREFQTMIGRNHARYFDAEGWLYFTREVFDLFYPSYGDTWPTFNGAIGMTYEQGGSGRAGLVILTATGDTLTLADRIAHHHTTGLSTVEVTARNHERVVEEFQDYFRTTQADPPGRYRTFVVKGSNHPDHLAALTDLLDRQGIRYGRAPADRSIRGFHYATGAGDASLNLTRDDLLISAFQPKAVLVSVLFEPQATLADSLTYDITAWSLPYAYGLDAYALTERIDPSDEPLDPTSPADSDASGGTPYAYLAEWKSPADLKLLVALLNADVRVRFATESFTVAETTYAPGTLIVTRADNADMGAAFDEAVRNAVAETGQPAVPVASGLVTRGSDFGSSNVRYLQKPRVALLSGEGTNSNAFGEAWHFFEQQIGYPVTVINTQQFNDTDWDEFDVLVLQSGSYGRVLTDSTLEDLQGWIRRGGRLIAIEGAASFLAGKDGFGLKRKNGESDDADEGDEGDEGDGNTDTLRTYGEREREAIQEAVIGSIYAVRMDNTHPLAYGYGDTYFSLKRSDTVYEHLEDGWNVGTLGEEGYRSGFTGSKAQAKLEAGLVFGVEPMGRGQVVYLAENPLFRGFWYGGKLLVGNAVFMVGQ